MGIGHVVRRTHVTFRSRVEIIVDSHEELIMLFMPGNVASRLFHTKPFAQPLFCYIAVEGDIFGLSPWDYSANQHNIYTVCMRGAGGRACYGYFCDVDLTTASRIPCNSAHVADDSHGVAERGHLGTSDRF